MRRYMRFALLALAVPALAAAAQDLPKRKPGLWEYRMQSSMAPAPMVSQQCIDTRTDDLMLQSAQQGPKPACSKTSERQEGARTLVDTVCAFQGTTVTTHAVFTGSFDSGYHADMHSTYSPPLMGMQDVQQTLDAKWLGPCKPGQRPGDITMQGMGTMNMNDMQEMMKNMPRMPDGR